MPVATITPLNSTQTNLLANALNGSTGTLAQALNAAIQRSQQDVQVQAQQEDALLTERQRRLANDRAERFDLRNRFETDRAFRASEDGRRFIEGLKNKAEERTAIRFEDERIDRVRAEELDVTAPELAAAQNERAAAASQSNLDTARVNRGATKERVGIAKSQEERLSEEADRRSTKAEKVNETQDQIEAKTLTTIEMLQTRDVNQLSDGELVAARNVLKQSKSVEAQSTLGFLDVAIEARNADKPKEPNTEATSKLRAEIQSLENSLRAAGDDEVLKRQLQSSIAKKKAELSGLQGEVSNKTSTIELTD